MSPESSASSSSSGEPPEPPEPLAIAAAVFLPASRRELPLLLSYRPPRTTVLQPLHVGSPKRVAQALQSSAVRDVSVALVDADPRKLAPTAREILALLPDAEILVVDPRAARRFLWFYRDHHDPLALGHACSRVLLDPNFEGRAVPDIREARRKKDRLIAERDLRRLVQEMGVGLGVAPPLPPVTPARGGWSPHRLAGLYDACAGLLVILLKRWGSSLASVEAVPGGVGRVRLMDEWLRRKDGPQIRARHLR